MRALTKTLCAVGLGATLALAQTSLGCGGGGATSGFGDGGSHDGGVDATKPPIDSGYDSPKIHLVDGLPTGDACVNLECAQTCKTTSITGKVYDPAGLIPLYNVYVYVPNAPLDVITSGITPGTCNPCQAPASGNPIASATTAPDGTFTITGAPSGTDIPVVLQLGKWRRHLTIPSIANCGTATLPDGTFRMPRKQQETSPDDNIPLIAFTTGCDGAECF